MHARTRAKNEIDAVLMSHAARQTAVNVAQGRQGPPNAQQVGCAFRGVRA
jgi:hypothetical protein